MINLTYEYKLNPNPDQAALIEQWLEVSRRVWNFALRERKDWINSRKCPVNACSLKSEYIISADEPYPSYHIQAKRLTTAKESNEDLKAVNAQVLQQVLRRLDLAFEEMRRKGLGFPRFKKPGQFRSLVFPQMLKNPMQGDVIKLPGVGRIQARMSRPIPEGFELKQARIVRKTSGYFVMLSLQCNVQVPEIQPHGHPRGIDLGLNTFAATSDGELIARPRFFVERQRELELLQRRLKHKQKGSNNQRQLSRKISRLHQRINDTRKDYHFKTAHHLGNDAGMIFAEDLNLKAMSKGMLCKHNGTCFKSAKLPNAVPPLDAGFGQFLTILGWVCWKRGVFFAKVDPNGTSQTCPQCEAYTPKDLSLRVHICPECKYTTDRDVAAAQVVVARGLSAVGHTVDKLPVEGKCLGHPMKQELSEATLGIFHHIA